jgi:hypothetical protein
MPRVHGLNKDVCGGLLMMGIGVFVAIHSISYNVGALTHMGPGFFPLTLGVILVLVGFAIGITGLTSERTRPHATYRPEWKGWLLICASLVAFIVFARYGGLVAATFATVFIAALGDRNNSWRSSGVLALAMVVVGVVVFGWALKVQLPLFTWGGV